MKILTIYVKHQESYWMAFVVVGETGDPAMCSKGYDTAQKALDDLLAQLVKIQPMLCI